MPKASKPYDDDDEEEEFEIQTGQCKDCVHYDIERDGEDISDDTLAACLHPDLEEYTLTVSGDSGCNLFEPASEYEDEDEDEDEEEDEDKEDAY